MTQKLVKDLRRGSRGKQVAMLQTRLKVLGYFPVATPSTGFYGEVTEASVRRVEGDCGYPVNGVVEPALWALLWEKPAGWWAKLRASGKAKAKGYSPIWRMTQAAKLRAFGDRDQVRKALVQVSWRGHKYHVHEHAAPQLRKVFAAIEAYEEQHGLKPWRPRQVGSWCWRLIRGGTSLSSHCWAAWDWDWNTNPMTSNRKVWRSWAKSSGRIPQYVINAARANGARWGGDYRTRKDFMHFEL